MGRDVSATRAAVCHRSLSLCDLSGGTIPRGTAMTESDLQQAVSNMSNNDFVKKELSSSSDALMKQAANDSALGPAQYDSTNHLMVQDLNMNVAGAGPVRAVLFHHFGRHALVSVMCYDQKSKFFPRPAGVRPNRLIVQVRRGVAIRSGRRRG